MEIVKQLEELVRGAVDASNLIKTFPGTIRLVSHYDADGISSAAIMVRALQREGKCFRLSFVKQLSGEAVESLKGDSEKLVVFTDLGSGFQNDIAKHLLGAGRKIVILDHHEPQGSIPEEHQEQLVHVNPMLNGITEDLSGSGVTYLMARALSPTNKDLAELAIIGAIGDSQTGSIGEHWGLLGINKEILKDAESTGKVRLEKGLRLWGRYGRPVHKALQYSMDPFIPGVSGSESGSVQLLGEVGIDLKSPTGEWKTLAGLTEEETQKLATGIIKQRMLNGEENPEWIFGDVYELPDKDGPFRDANEFATMLNACGKTGNAWAGVSICLNDPAAGADVKKVMSSYRREIGKALQLVRRSRDIIRSTPNAEYILAGSRVSEHVISNVVSIMEKSCLVPDGQCGKPMFAFADTEDGQVKVSARASDALVEKGLSMKDAMAEASKEFDCQGGGHAGAAGATIPRGSEERFINTVEKLLTARNQAEPGEGAAPEDACHERGAPDNNIKESVQIQESPQPSEKAAAEERSLSQENVGPSEHAHQEQSDTKALNGAGVNAGASAPGEKESNAGASAPGDAGVRDSHRSACRHEVAGGSEHGRIRQGNPAQGEGKGREEEGQGRQEGSEAEEGDSPDSKEMERKGLVRYLFS